MCRSETGCAVDERAGWRGAVNARLEALDESGYLDAVIYRSNVVVARRQNRQSGDRTSVLVESALAERVAGADAGRDAVRLAFGHILRALAVALGRGGGELRARFGQFLDGLEQVGVCRD